jgi:putative chitinase
MTDAEQFTLEDLAELVGMDKAKIFYPGLLLAFRKYKINTAQRQGHFLAQILHESGGFQFLEELWGPTPAQSGYEGRADLGNYKIGDGYFYRGRGLIQLTGRANYRRAGGGLGLPLEANPGLASKPATACLIAGWFWDTRFTRDALRPIWGLNYWADRGNLERITQAINGGLNGFTNRRDWLIKAKKALGVT